jgi:hypothetical protein
MTDSKKSGSIQLTIRSAPFLSEPQGAAAYYESMGRVVALWGRFESHFGHDLLTITTLKGGNKLLTPFPRAFQKKIDAWKMCFDRVKVLKPYKKVAREFAALVKPIARKRNIVAHGSFWTFVSESPLTGEFQMIVWRGNKFGFQKHHCTLEEMQQMAVHIDNLNTQLTRFSFVLSGLHRDATKNIFQ